MKLHRNNKAVVGYIEHSTVFPVLASLLIWFVLAWSIVRPWFTEPAGEFLHGAAPLAREVRDPLIDDAAAPSEKLYGEFLPLEETVPPSPWTVERNKALPAPELFVKTTPTDGGYLLTFSTNNFAVGTDGYLVLTKDGKPDHRIYASPYFIADGLRNQAESLAVHLMNNNNEIITINDVSVEEQLFQ